MAKSWLLVFCIVLAIPRTDGGPATYGVCQSGCAAAVCACYTAGNLVFGTVTAGVGAPAVALVCNAKFGKCSAACAAMSLTPTP